MIKIHDEELKHTELKIFPTFYNIYKLSNGSISEYYIEMEKYDDSLDQYLCKIVPDYILQEMFNNKQFNDKDIQIYRDIFYTFFDFTEKFDNNYLPFNLSEFNLLYSISNPSNKNYNVFLKFYIRKLTDIYNIMEEMIQIITTNQIDITIPNYNKIIDIIENISTKTTILDIILYYITEIDKIMNIINLFIPLHNTTLFIQAKNLYDDGKIIINDSNKHVDITDYVSIKSVSDYISIFFQKIHYFNSINEFNYIKFKQFIDLYQKYFNNILYAVKRQVIHIIIILELLGYTYIDLKTSNLGYKLLPNSIKHNGIIWNDNLFFGQYLYIYLIDIDPSYSIEKISKRMDDDENIVNIYNNFFNEFDNPFHSQSTINHEIIKKTDSENNILINSEFFKLLENNHRLYLPEVSPVKSFSEVISVLNFPQDYLSRILQI
jgi:hypothetical protein